MTDDWGASERQSYLDDDDDDSPQANTDLDIKEEVENEDLDDTLADPSSQEGGANELSADEGTWWLSSGVVLRLCVCGLALSSSWISCAIAGDKSSEPSGSQDDVPFSQRLAIYRRQEEARLEKVPRYMLFKNISLRFLATRWCFVFVRIV